MKRVAIYARCSTNEQSVESQITYLKKYCVNRGWTDPVEITDSGYSGSTDKRPGLEKLLKLVRRHDVDVVCVVKLDRFFRSLRHLVLTLEEFHQRGCVFISIEDNIDLTTSIGRMQMQIIGAVAEFELSLLKNRTLIGLENAKAKGKKLGRPMRQIDEKIISLRAAGKTYKQIQDDLQCSPASITRALERASKTGPINETK